MEGWILDNIYIYIHTREPGNVHIRNDLFDILVNRSSFSCPYRDTTWLF